MERIEMTEIEEIDQDYTLEEEIQVRKEAKGFFRRNYKEIAIGVGGVVVGFLLKSFFSMKDSGDGCNYAVESEDFIGDDPEE